MMAPTARPPLTVVWSQAFLDQGTSVDDIPVGPWTADRYRTILDALRAAHLLDENLAPRAATLEEIGLVHAEEYIQRIRHYSTGLGGRCDDYHIVAADTALTTNTFAHASLGVGAAIAAVDAVFGRTATRAAVHVQPGCHHAYPFKGGGFCIFNHTAVAARYAQRAFGVERVLIVDFDVHHGDGTQVIFSSDPSVYTYSIHQYGGSFYPRSGHSTEKGTGPGRGSNLNVTIDAGTSDRRYLEAFARGLRSIPMRPDLVLVVAGFDGHRDDPVGGLRLSDAVYPTIAARLRDYADTVCDGRLISVLAGGYNVDTVGRLAATYFEVLKA
jgi:acetoin utilization deacetylase AcuC-like enzyme